MFDVQLYYHVCAVWLQKAWLSFSAVATIVKHCLWRTDWVTDWLAFIVQQKTWLEFDLLFMEWRFSLSAVLDSVEWSFSLNSFSPQQQKSTFSTEHYTLSVKIVQKHSHVCTERNRENGRRLFPLGKLWEKRRKLNSVLTSSANAKEKLVKLNSVQIVQPTK